MKNKTHYLLVAFLLVTVSFVGCKKDDDDDNTPAPPAITVDSPEQMTGKIDGVAFSWVTGGSNPYQGTVSSGGPVAFPPDSSEFILGTGMENIVTGDYLMDINLGTYRFLAPTDSIQMTNFFAIKSWNYSIDAENGVEIIYYDSNSWMWSTSYGTASQAGSTFSLQERKYFEFLGEPYMTIKASFNCVLYNGLGASKVLTDGVVVANFTSDF